MPSGVRDGYFAYPEIHRFKVHFPRLSKVRSSFVAQKRVTSTANRNLGSNPNGDSRVAVAEWFKALSPLHFSHSCLIIQYQVV